VTQEFSNIQNSQRHFVTTTHKKKKIATTLRPAKTCVLYETTTSALGLLHGALLPLGFTVLIRNCSSHQQDDTLIAMTLTPPAPPTPEFCLG
jgi:hypothetical protein